MHASCITHGVNFTGGSVLVSEPWDIQYIHGQDDRCFLALALQLLVWHRPKQTQIKSAVLRSNCTRLQALCQVEASSEVQQPRVDDMVLFQKGKKMRS
jgi:hypothetical protein